MVSPQLLEYIKTQIGDGVSAEEVKSQLIAKGWQIGDIADALNAVTLESNVHSNFPAQNTVFHNQVTDTPTKRFSKKFLIFVLFPLLMILALFIMIFTKIGPSNITKPKYIPSYLPTGFTESGFKFEKNNKGENAYILTYSSASGGLLFFTQITNPIDRQCAKQPESNTKVTGYHEFLPIGSTFGCVHTLLPSDGSKIYYFRWMKDNVWYDLTATNYNLTDDEALKIANSIYIQENN